MLDLPVRKSLLVVTVLSVFLCGCPPDTLVAGFTASVSAGNAPLAVQFTDTSTAASGPITGWLWNFGDGATSTDQNPTHTYNVAGTYDVALEVSTASASNSVTQSGLIVVGEPSAYTADFTATVVSGPAPLATTFSSTVAPSRPAGATYSWAFGDGESSTAASPKHTYADPGSYTVSLVVNTPAGPAIKTRAGFITVTGGEGNPGCEDGGAPPVIVECPAPRSISVTDPCSYTMPNMISAVIASDDCGIASITQFPTPGTLMAVSANVQFQVTDVDGNSATCSTTVTIKDDVKPILQNCPASVTAYRGDGCKATVPSVGQQVTVVENCFSNIVTQSPLPGTEIDGDTVATLTATDGSGNTATCSVPIHVADNRQPVISVCPSLATVLSGATCGGVVPDLIGDVFATDNCGIAQISQNPAAGTAFTDAVEILITVKDSSGNTTQCTTGAVIKDETPPLIVTCAADVTVPADGNCHAIMPSLRDAVVATDVCGVKAVTQLPLAGVPITGTTNVTLTVHDFAENTATCNAVVRLTDTTPPVFTKTPPNATVNASANCSAVLPNLLGGAQATDSCGTATVSQSPAAGLEIVQDTLVTLTARDASGNTATAQAKVSLKDVTAPVIATCPAGRTLALGAACSATLPDLAAELVATDNCAGGSVQQTPPAGTAISANTTATLVVQDASGNASSCTVSVTVADQTDPSIVCPAPLSIERDATCSAVVPDFATTANASDNCPGVTVAQMPSAGTVITASTNVVLTATDAGGRTAQCFVPVTLTDVMPPVITNCPVLPKLTRNVFCEATVPDLTAGIAATDACGIASVTQSPVAGAVIGAATTAAITVTDTNGNATQCSVQIDLDNCAVTPPAAALGAVNLDRVIEGAGNYAPGEPLDVTVVLRSFGSDAPTDLVLDENLPIGWQYAAVIGAKTTDPEVICGIDGACTLQFTFSGTLALPFTFTYQVVPPVDGKGTQIITGTADYTSPHWGHLTTNAEETLVPLDGTIVLLDHDLPDVRVYTPGQPLDVRLEMRRIGAENLTALGLTEILPPGWQFTAIVSGPTPDIAPAAGSTGTLEFAWITPPTFSAVITIRVKPPLAATGVAILSGQVQYHVQGLQDLLFSNNEQTYIPADASTGEGEGKGEGEGEGEGQSMLFVLTDVSPDFYVSHGSPLTLSGDFSAPYDAGTLNVYIATNPPTTNPAVDHVLTLGANSSTEIQASVPSGLYLTPGSYLVYLAATSGARTILSNPENVFVTFCGVDDKSARPKAGGNFSGSVLVDNSGVFTPGQLIEVVATYNRVVTGDLLTALGNFVVLPFGWSFDSLGSSECPPDIKPSKGATGQLNFAWITLPGLPTSYSFFARAGSDAASIGGTIVYRFTSTELNDPLTAAAVTPAK